MVYYCAVALCTNSSKNRPDLSFHTFPKDAKRRRVWKIFCRRADKEFKISRHSSVCKEHFKEDDFRKTLTGRVELKNTVKPSIFKSSVLSPTKIECNDRANKRHSTSSEKETTSKKRRQCMERKSQPVCKRQVQFVSQQELQTFILHDHCYDILPSEDTETDESSHENIKSEDDMSPNDKSCQTDLSGEDIDELIKTKNKLSEELKNESKLKRTLFMKEVTKNDTSVNFYTGIPSVACLMTLFNLVQPQASKMRYWDGDKANRPKNYQRYQKTEKPGRKRTMTLFEEFVLTLVRLRLGLLRTHLSHIFGVSESQISKVFITWITFLCHELKSFIIWPTKEQIQTTLPPEFKRFPNTRVVIDCTEVFIEKPTLPSAQKSTWSEYKEHNTIKTLVGITPTGTFSFVSNFWTGSVSDRRITQESGFLERLEEGDEVMADKGFNISDLVIRKKATLNIPPLARGKKCLTMIEKPHVSYLLLLPYVPLGGHKEDYVCAYLLLPTLCCL